MVDEGRCHSVHFPTHSFPAKLVPQSRPWPETGTSLQTNVLQTNKWGVGGRTKRML